MYQNNWQSYLYSLSQLINQQQQKIKTLEKRLKQLEDTIKTLQENPSTNVEKIEYHFDQLKIETLEGTLNIGITPQGITSAEEFAIPNPTVNQLKPNQPQQAFMQEIMQDFQPFFNDELPNKINEFVVEHRKSFPPGFETIILQDIYRQLPQRIEHYTRLHSENSNGLLNEQTKNQVLTDVKNEILHSVKKYIEGGSST